MNSGEITLLALISSVVIVFAIFFAERLDNTNKLCRSENGVLVQTPDGWRCLKNKDKERNT